MRAAVAALALLAPMLFGAGPAQAFGTIRAMGQDAEHSRITRRALACERGAPAPCFEGATLEALAGPITGAFGGFGHVGWPDRPDSGLVLAHKAHCDDGDHLDRAGYPRPAAAAAQALEDCRDWMALNLDAAVGEAEGLQADPVAAKARVLRRFGIALHAAQDFYAHSNWTDALDAVPPGLGQAGPAPFIDLHTRAPPPPGLISGCFTGLPEALFCHGRVRHADLDKDTGRIDPQIGPGTTPRGAGAGFAPAVEAAVADTAAKWALLRTRLAEAYGPARAATMVCVLTRDEVERC